MNNNNNNNTNNDIMIQNIITKHRDRKKYTSYTMKYNLIITYNMIPSIKYISPALLFNKSFLKLYIYIVSGLFLNYSLLLFIDLLLNRVVLTLHCIS